MVSIYLSVAYSRGTDKALVSPYNQRQRYLFCEWSLRDTLTCEVRLDHNFCIWFGHNILYCVSQIQRMGLAFRFILRAMNPYVWTLEIGIYQ